MQPGWQPWPVVPLPPRLWMMSALFSPLSEAAPSKRPLEKLRVGRPPASFRTLISASVPYELSVPPFLVRSCVSEAFVSFLMATSNSAGLAMGTGAWPSSSSTMALSPLEPMTAPSPPRPA